MRTITLLAAEKLFSKKNLALIIVFMDVYYSHYDFFVNVNLNLLQTN
jgi:hypothetical protein